MILRLHNTLLIETVERECAVVIKIKESARANPVWPFHP